MVKPNIEKHFLPCGTLSFDAPLNYCIGITDSYGRLNLTLENKNKKFICIPIPD